MILWAIFGNSWTTIVIVKTKYALFQFQDFMCLEKSGTSQFLIVLKYSTISDEQQHMAYYTVSLLI